MKKQDYTLSEYLDYLRDSSVPHNIIYTRRTRVVRSALGDKEIFSNSSFNTNSMNLIQKVKREALKNIDEFKHLDVDYRELGLKLFSFNEVLLNFPDSTYENVIEVDLNKAYWVAAHKLGITSSEVFNKGMKGIQEGKLTKVHLLASLGGFAMIKRQSTYIPEEDTYLNEVLDDSSRTRYLWNAISWEVDKCMQEIKNTLGLDFYFYWTDAAFIENTKENIYKVEEIIKKHGFESKKINIKYIDVQVEPSRNNPENNIVNINVWTKEKKSNAKNPKINDQGHYSREFRFEESEIRQFLNQLKKLKDAGTKKASKASSDKAKKKRNARNKKK